MLVANASSSSPTSPTDTVLKPLLQVETSSKNKRLNQAELGYFNPHLNRTHGDREVVSVEKEVYYKNVVLFIQQIQGLITF